MPPLKSILGYNPRISCVSPPSQSLGIVLRGISGTIRNSSQLQSAPKPPSPTPFIKRIFVPTTAQPTHTQLISRPNTNSSNDSNPFTTLVTSLTQSLTTHPSPNLSHLTALLRSYTSSPTHWQQFAHANASKQYTRNLVYEVPGLFNLLLLVWTPGKQSPIHDHADAHCLMKILQGDLVERRFEIPKDGTSKGEMNETVRKRYEVGKVAYMADQLGLHEISNPSPTEYAVSLHLYTPPNAAMRGCHIYDFETGEAKHIMQGAYDSVNGIPTMGI